MNATVHPHGGARVVVKHPRHRAYLGFLRNSAGGVLLALDLAVAATANAATTQLESVKKDYMITVWESDRSNLPHYCFPSITQTPDGYLWLGSFGNLSHFDGNRFVVLDHLTNAVDRPGDAVRKLFVDHAGGLWVGNDRGIACLKDGKWQAFTKDQGWPGGGVGSFAEDRKGNLWAAAGSDIIKLDGDHFVPFPDPDRSADDNTSLAVWIDAAGRLWANSEHYLGVWRDGKWLAAPLNVDDICGIIVSRSGGLWVADANRIRKWENGRWTRGFEIPEGFRDESIALIEDSHGNVWAGGYTKGVLCFTTDGSVLRCTTEDGLANNQTLCLFEDREGQIWIGSNGGGLARLRPRTVMSYGADAGLTQEIVNSITEDSSGRLLVATHGGGLLPFDERTGRFSPPLVASHARPLPGGRVLGASSWVHTVVKDHSGTVWAGTYGDGLFRIRGTNIDQVPIRGVGQETVFALFVDSKNRLWLGSDKGLFCRDQEKFTQYGTNTGLPAGQVDMIAEDGDGNIWAGASTKYVARQQGSRFVEFNVANPDSLYAGRDGSMWIGSDDGSLTHASHGKTFVYGADQGVPQVNVSAMTEDDAGDLWIGSGSGIVQISRWSLNNVAEARQSRLNCILFDRADGMRSSVCHDGFQPAAFRSADGRLWFATLKGLAMIDPKKIPVKRISTPVLIVKVIADKDTILPVLAGSPPRFIVPPGKKRVEIHYSGICLGDSEDVHFQYRREGLDRHWVDADTERVARLYDLDPGQYQFTVRALNKDQTWSQDEATIAFAVLPFFWQTTWFRVMAVLGLVGGVGGTVWRIQSARARREWEQHEQEQALAEERAQSAALAKAKKALQGALQRFEAVIENAPLIAIQGYDQQGVIQHWNAASQVLYGLSRAETVGRHIQDFPVLNGEVHEFEARLQEVWTTGKPSAPREWTLRNCNGEERHVLSSMFPVSRKGNILEVFCMDLDITERKELEEQLRQAQKMEAIGQLAGGVAHDFNNILTVIQGHVGLLLAYNPQTSAETGESLKEIAAAAERAANLTHQLLAFSRRQVLRAKPMDLDETLENLSKMLRRLLGEHIALSFHYTPESAWVNADAGMLEQIVLNLAVNARDAMPKGGRLAISTAMVKTDEDYARRKAEARAGRFVCLSVADTGCGMDEATLDRIFEPFFTTKQVGKGTGLGLATVYGIVKQHQGWVEVESAVGKGTTFKVFLPACDKPAPENSATPAPAPRGGSETLLVVEDEPPVRQLVGDCLRRYGYQVLEARDGAEALTVWKQHRNEINLLLTDMVMPGGMNGGELAAKLKAENSRLKVIYSSGYSLEMATGDLRLEDDAVYLAKPYDPDELATAIRECLDN